MLTTFVPKIHAYVSSLSSGESGQGLAEYSLILLLIAAVAIVILTTLGLDISSLLSTVSGQI